MILLLSMTIDEIKLFLQIKTYEPQNVGRVVQLLLITLVIGINGETTIDLLGIVLAEVKVGLQQMLQVIDQVIIIVVAHLDTVEKKTGVTQTILIYGDMMFEQRLQDNDLVLAEDTFHQYLNGTLLCIFGNI